MADAHGACLYPGAPASVPPLSRRKLLAGVAASSTLAPSIMASGPDPVLPLWREWQADMVQAEVLRSEWSRLEQALLQLVGANRFEETMKAGAPEAGDLLNIETRQLELDRRLDTLVRTIIDQSSQTRAGIAAKLALALELADPVERADPSWRLVQGALNELSALDHPDLPAITTGPP
ncbi:chromosome condensin MukBEF ATPase and DNA-binding subunit MukB [Azospirillum fermentarium]|uniref:hypothetical protein n=1 Tax=Azospirillum fermentarium TaxID=1233114 RepID=UPI0022273468|nr:hypothetical protein [Azospirillum fermentarium]MCW2245143.1 chromosome condensin MukBEF ATPase and DNA-binding subunit MukB [Azospirillum fermentarium]